MRAQLLHLSGPGRGHTVTYPSPNVRIGSSAENEAQLRAPEVERYHARIDWVQPDCHFYLRRVDGQVFVNGDEIEEVILHDGDELEFGAGGPRARFRRYPPGAVCKPVRRMLADARDVAHFSGRLVGTGAFTRDLFTQATAGLKIGVPVVIVVSAFLAGWLGGWLGSRPNDKMRADTVTHAELDVLRGQANAQHDALQQLVAANATVRRIQREWSRGVCLLHGVYRVRMPDGQWYERGAEPFEREYTGSGFLASADGHIVTNRHVAMPWQRLPDLAQLIEQGAVPEFVHLTATFPGRAPIAVPPDGIRHRDDDLDVAVLQIDRVMADGIPVLPLRRGNVEPDDQRAIVVGYPLGLAALLARADKKLVEQLRERSATYAETIDALAAANEVAPLITQGIVSEVKADQIVYDALTTFGGSGGPVFGSDGEVIAVNAAVMANYGGANFGVPIRFAGELLTRK